jgi:hypothetical protein
VKVGLAEPAAPEEAAAVAKPEALPPATDEAEGPAVEEAAAEEEEAEQDRSKRGVVLRVLPTIPKLGLGVTGLASCRMYHQVLVLPNRGHPTSSQ